MSAAEHDPTTTLARAREAVEASDHKPGCSGTYMHPERSSTTGISWARCYECGCLRVEATS